MRLPADEALERLRQGNLRFVRGVGGRMRTGLTRVRQLTPEQQPWAVILGCADSRTAPEVVFDQGLGELFVIRVAGNLAPPTVLGSIEYAVTQLGVRLVVVLGHSACGAVTAAVDGIDGTGMDPSGPLAGLVDSIRPQVEAVRQAAAVDDGASLLERAIRNNVRHSVERIREAFARTAPELRIIGAEYDLATGHVHFHP